MIDLHTWTTPNGRKPAIMLEETGLPYRVHAVDISKGEQFQPGFLAVSPNNKIPAIVDHDAPGGPLSVFESGAILVYLAEKTDKLLPSGGAARFKVMEWLFWQVGGLGPMAGQFGYFALRAETKNPDAVSRFDEEVRRLLGVMDRRLGQAEYLGGDDYSIADVACYAWTISALGGLKKADGEQTVKFDSVDRWLKTVGDRPAVKRGMEIPKV
jgi:GSH-dependent disulfide-bond oxidoreductase